jgi:hypothetical protein
VGVIFFTPTGCSTDDSDSRVDETRILKVSTSVLITDLHMIRCKWEVHSSKPEIRLSTTDVKYIATIIKLWRVSPGGLCSDMVKEVVLLSTRLAECC